MRRNAEAGNLARTEQVSFPDSSVVRWTGYPAGKGALDVGYKSGEVYRYFGVPPNVLERFKEAESAGGFLNEEILDRYKFKRIK